MEFFLISFFYFHFYKQNVFISIFFNLNFLSPRKLSCFKFLIFFLRFTKLPFCSGCFKNTSCFGERYQRFENEKLGSSQTREINPHASLLSLDYGTKRSFSGERIVWWFFCVFLFLFFWDLIINSSCKMPGWDMCRSCVKRKEKRGFFSLHNSTSS